MTITRHDLATRLNDFLQGNLPLTDLVVWSEQMLIEHDFDTDATRDAVARLGVADVRAFGLTWEDCRDLLSTLGYTTRVEVVA